MALFTDLPPHPRTTVVIEADRVFVLQARDTFGAAGLQVVSFDDGRRARDDLRDHRGAVEAALADVDLCGQRLGVGLAHLSWRPAPASPRSQRPIVTQKGHED